MSRITDRLDDLYSVDWVVKQTSSLLTNCKAEIVPVWYTHASDLAHQY